MLSQATIPCAGCILNRILPLDKQWTLHCWTDIFVFGVCLRRYSGDNSNVIPLRMFTGEYLTLLYHRFVSMNSEGLISLKI